MKMNRLLSYCALLSALIALASCIETNPDLGYGLIPDGQLLRTKQDTMDLPVGLKMADSIATTSSTSIVFGAINSPEYGLSEFGSATTFPPLYDSTVIDVGTNRRINEFYLNLELRRTEIMDGGSEGILQHINVYRLVKSFDSTSVYNCSLSEEYYDKSSTISVNGAVYNGSDTLHLLLSNDYAKEILDSLALNPDLADTVNNYNKVFPGLYFTVNAPATGIGEGRINNFKIQSYGRIKYTADFGDRKDVDTSIIFATGLIDGASDYRFALNTSEFNSQAFETPEADGYILVEGNAGIKPVVSSSYIMSAMEQLAADEGVGIDRLLISRATLRFPFEFPSDYKQVDDLYPVILSPSIKMHTDEGRVLYSCITDVNISDEDPGNINRSLAYYSPDITHYLQRLLKKKTDELSEDDDIWLIPTTKDKDTNEDEDSDDDSSSYYNYYNPYLYYDPYGYGGYYGYGYGYGGYYGYNPYGYYGYYNYGQSEESDTETITLDSVSHFSAVLNGCSSDNPPKLIVTYSIIPTEEN